MDAAAAGCRMLAVLQGINAMIGEPRYAAPDDHITMVQHDTLRLVGTRYAAERKLSRQCGAVSVCDLITAMPSTTRSLFR